VENTRDKYLTVLTFTYAHEAAIVRGRLEAEGIESTLQDELTAQVYPFYSNAIGGVKLMVRESDLPKTMEILLEGGYIKKSELEQPKFDSWLETILAKYDTLNKRALSIVIVSIIVAVLLITFIISYATKPSTDEQLINNTWCVGYVIYNETIFIPHTIDVLQLSETGRCIETINFRENGTAIIPGLDSRSVVVSWQLNDNFIHLFNADTLGDVYNGDYKIEISNTELVLKSANTTISSRAE